MACQFWLTHCCTQGTWQGCEWISTSLSSQASHNLLLGPHSTKRAVLFYCTPQVMPCMEMLHLIACVCKGHLSGQQLKLCFQRLLPIGLVWGMISNQIPLEPYDPIDIMLMTVISMSLPRAFSFSKQQSANDCLGDAFSSVSTAVGGDTCWFAFCLSSDIFLCAWAGSLSRLPFRCFSSLRSFVTAFNLKLVI